MQVYCVFREGVYRHECGGVFTTLELAKEAAIGLIRQESDDYHTYGVVPFNLDEITAIDKNKLKELEPVFTVGRKRNEVFENQEWPCRPRAFCVLNGMEY